MEENTQAGEIDSKSEVENVSATSKKIKVRVAAPVVEKELKSAYAAFQKKAHIKGFRKGKAPADQIRKIFKEDVESEVSKRLVSLTLYSSLEQLAIRPVSVPRLTDLNFAEGTEFQYSVEVDVKPEIKLKKYTGLELTRRKIQVEDAEVDREIEGLRESMATIKTVTEDREVQNWDVVTIDFEGFVNGVPFAGGKAEKYSLEVGSKSLIPGFEEQVVGMKKGESRDVKVKFPEDYKDEDLKGKDAVFKVLVHEIKIKELPSLDDKLAESTMGLKTVTEMREGIRKHLLEHKESEEKAREREEVLNAIIRENPIDAPEGLVERIVQSMKQDTEKRMQQMGLPPRKDWDAGVMESYRRRAIFDIKSAYLLEKVAEQENISVSDDDVTKRLEEIAVARKAKVEEVRKRYTDKDLELLKDNLRDEKAVEFIREKAKIKER